MIKKCCKIIFAFSLTMFNSCCDEIINSKDIKIDEKEILKPEKNGFFTNYEIKGITSEKKYLEKYYFVKANDYNKLIAEEKKVEGYVYDFDTIYYYKNIYTKKSWGFGIFGNTVTEIYKIRKPS